MSTIERRTMVTAEAHSTAPAERVWALLSQARTWSDWAAFAFSDLEREGDPAPDGIGAIRRFGFRVYTSREQVIAFDPPTHLAYTLLSGLPLRSYRADVTLTPAPDGGTDILWQSSFVPPWPGSAWFWRGFLSLVLRDTARRLAKGAARQA